MLTEPHKPVQDDRSGWLVIWTASRAEKVVESRLMAMGIQAWTPKLVERRKWSDRWREVVTPLFPGYVFARTTAGHWSHLLRICGVLTVVKEGGQPALLSDSFISCLRNAIERGGTMIEKITEPVKFRAGDEVVVQEGVLAGIRGVVRQAKNGRQLVIWVAEIGHGVAFTIGSALVLHSPSTSNQ